MIGRVIKSKHNLWRSTLTAMNREDVHSFGLAAPSIYVEYHKRSAVALVTSLEDPSERHKYVTMHLLTHQVAQLKALATSFLSTREGTSLPIKRQLNLHMRARQLACIHASKLYLASKGNSMFLDDLKLRSHLRPQASPPPTLATLINCITKPLMDLGITGFHYLTSANEKYIVSGRQLRNKYTRVFNKHIIALNRLAAIANLPGTQELSPTSIAQILQERNSEHSILHNYCKINNSSFTGLLDTHINTSAHEEMPPNPTITQTQQTLPIYTTPAPQPRSATHHRHPITNNFIRGPPPTHTDPSTCNGHPNRSSVFDTPNLKPQTSPASSIITTKAQTETQGHAALNVPTLSFLKEITPNVQNSMLDPGNAQHMATYPALSFPKHNTPSPQR